MTFDTRESSRFDGEPTNLYWFRGATSELNLGKVEEFAYCDNDDIIVREGLTFTPWAIDRDRIKISGSPDDIPNKIRLALGNPLADLFIAYPPSYKILLTIFQGNVGDEPTAANFPALWNGTIENPTYLENEIELTCRSTRASLGRIGLKKHYQLGCPLVLYGKDCRASQSDATTVNAVSNILGSEVALNQPLTDPEKYIGGMLRWTTEQGFKEVRTISGVSDDGTTLRIRGLLRGISIGTAVDVILGCNHQVIDCRDLHTNIHNYGGQPWIPTENPLSSKNLFF